MISAYTRTIIPNRDISRETLTSGKVTTRMMTPQERDKYQINKHLRKNRYQYLKSLGIQDKQIIDMHSHLTKEKLINLKIRWGL